MRVNLLGEIQLWTETGRIPASAFATRKVAELLLILLQQSTHCLSLDQLVEYLWPTHNPEAARKNLHVTAGHLRRVLEPQLKRPADSTYLLTEADSYRLVTETWIIDTELFEQYLREGQRAQGEQRWAEGIAAYRSARALYRGDYLSELPEAEWALPVREKYRQLWLDGLEVLAACYTALNQPRAALEVAQNVIDHDPLRESAWRQIMAAHVALDETGLALRAYHTCVTQLYNEVGAGPGPETQRLYRQIRGGSSILLTVPEIKAPHTLVGRTTEWTQLHRLWQTAVKGAPQVVLLQGETGVGKTRLAVELSDWAVRQNIAVLKAQCYAAENRLAYAPLTTLLRSLPLPHLPPDRRVEIARLLPEVLHDRPDLPTPGPLAEAWQRQRFFEVLARVVLSQAPSPQRGLLIFLDDVQWCDRDSLEWLLYFLHFAGEAQPHLPIVWLATLRPDEIGDDHPLPPLLTALRRHRQLHEVLVAPLDRAATEQLAAQLCGQALPATQNARLYMETEGNPLFIVEMLHGAADHTDLNFALTPTLQAVIMARLATLSSPAHELAGLAATIGRTFTYEVLEAAGRATLTPDQLVCALDELWQQRIVREAGATAYDFTHGKLSEVAYAELSAARKRRLHLRVAEALSEVHQTNLDKVSATIATHYDRAGQADRAADYYERAGDRAVQIYANDSAIAYYRRAVELSSVRPIQADVPRLLKLGNVLHLIGQWAEASEVYQRAYDHALKLQVPRLIAQCQRARGSAACLKGAYAEALAWLEPARSEFERLNDPRELGATLSEIATALWYQGHNAEALNCLQQQYDLATTIDDHAGLCQCLKRMGAIHADMGTYDRALDYHQRCAALATQLGDKRTAGIAAGNLGAVYWQLGEYDRALACLQTNLHAAHEIGDRRSVAIVLGNMGVLYQTCGDDERARLAFQHSLRLAVEMNDIWNMTIVSNLGVLAARQSGYAEAQRLLQQAIVLGRALQTPYYLCEFLHARAEALAHQQDYAAAQQLNDEALAYAQLVDRKDLNFAIQVLGLRLRASLEQITSVEASRELEALRPAWRADKEQAALFYAIWQIDHAADAARQAASQLYRSLYARSSHRDYRERYAELTGEQLPPPPPLPDLPAFITQQPLDFEGLLAKVDQAASLI
ncbi:Transcriptional regulatory protein MoaR1 [Thermoflexales bacterium]|nr:Transcriptional regulatory protein MoaR1 [Thermoflexales bacterium]